MLHVALCALSVACCIAAVGRFPRDRSHRKQTKLRLSGDDLERASERVCTWQGGWAVGWKGACAPVHATRASDFTCARCIAAARTAPVSASMRASTHVVPSQTGPVPVQKYRPQWSRDMFGGAGPLVHQHRIGDEESSQRCVPAFPPERHALSSALSVRRRSELQWPCICGASARRLSPRYPEHHWVPVSTLSTPHGPGVGPPQVDERLEAARGDHTYQLQRALPSLRAATRQCSARHGPASC